MYIATEEFLRAEAREAAFQALLSFNASSLLQQYYSVQSSLTTLLSNNLANFLSANRSMDDLTSQFSGTLNNLPKSSGEVWSVRIGNETNCCGSELVTVCTTSLPTDLLQFKITAFKSNPSLFRQISSNSSSVYNISRISRIDFMDGSAGCLQMTIFYSRQRSPGSLTRRSLSGQGVAYDSAAYSFTHNESQSWGYYSPQSVKGQEVSAAAAAAAITPKTTDPILVIAIISLSVHAIWIAKFVYDSRKVKAIIGDEKMPVSGPAKDMKMLLLKDTTEKLRAEIEALHRRPSYVARLKKKRQEQMTARRLAASGAKTPLSPAVLASPAPTFETPLSQQSFGYATPQVSPSWK